MYKYIYDMYIFPKVDFKKINNPFKMWDIGINRELSNEITQIAEK